MTSIVKHLTANVKERPSGKRTGPARTPRAAGPVVRSEGQDAAFASIHALSVGPDSKLVIIAYRGASPTWYTACHRRSVSTTNCAPAGNGMWLSVDGTMRQNGSTRTMIFGVAFLVHYISQFMSLQPGDIISTGTPPGVGLGMKPPVFLTAGQTIKLGIEGLGEQTQLTVDAA